MFICHVTTNPFFVPTQYGIEDASALLGTTFQWTGSETSDIPEMVNAFEAAIAGGADGIAVALVDLEAFNDPIQAALDAGIPVVVLQRRRPERPNDLRRPGSVRVGRSDGRAHRRARRRGQGRVVHRHAGPAEHPAAHRRCDPGDRASPAPTSSTSRSRRAPSSRRSSTASRPGTSATPTPPGCSPSTPAARKGSARWCKRRAPGTTG